jgi:hypothetical protein
MIHFLRRQRKGRNWFADFFCGPGPAVGQWESCGDRLGGRLKIVVPISSTYDANCASFYECMRRF